jgi:protein-S-isoprenylcysteine O-methyltransferase Ste14
LASIRTLGRYFTFTVQTSADQPVIDAGPYRWLRHPGYLGILLAVGGIGVEMGNWLSPLGFVALTAIGVVLRIRVEEGALVAAMGERYVEFTRGRKRLLPYLW